MIPIMEMSLTFAAAKGNNIDNQVDMAGFSKTVKIYEINAQDYKVNPKLYVQLPQMISLF